MSCAMLMVKLTTVGTGNNLSSDVAADNYTGHLQTSHG